MNILIVASYLPYPLHNGGHIRLYNLIKQLKGRHEITLICEKRSYQTAKDIEEVEKICHKVITVPRRKQWTPQNILRAGLSPNAFLMIGHTLPAMKEAIEEELKENSYDLIHIETFYVSQNLPKTTLPIVLVEHNIEYFIYRRYAEKSSRLLRPLLMVDVLKLQHAEEMSWAKAKVIATVSEDDKKIVNKPNSYVVANGVDTKQFSIKKIPKNFHEKDKKILYIGDFKYVQNRDAAEFIIKEVWPIIRAKSREHPKGTSFSEEALRPKSRLTLWIVGRNMPESLKELGKGDNSIIFDDANPKPTPEIFSEADVLLAPIRVGGGTSYKILESMAVGTPVVTTSLGLEGIKAEKDKAIVVADTPEELAEATITMLSDEKKYRAIAKNGREAIEKTYDWSAIAKDLERVYKIATE